MSILPILATSLLGSPSQPEPAPLWLAPEPLLAFPEQHMETNHSHGATSGTYFRLSGAVVTTTSSDGAGEEIDFDEGWGASIGIGRRLGASDTGLGFAIELDGIWTDSDTDSGNNPPVTDVTVGGLLLDGIVDFRMAERLALYAGVGIGAAWLDVGTEDDGLSDFNDEDGPFLTWTAKAGLQWHLGASTALHIGYRFLNVDDAELDDGLSGTSFDLQTQQHSLELGLIFGF